MKTTLSLLAFALMMQGPATSFADQAQRKKDFETANQRVLTKDAKGAIALYEHLGAEPGSQHPDVLFNLGTAYASAGRYVDAVVAFERSLRLQPDQPAARSNLVALRTHLSNGEPPDEPADPVDWIEPLVAPLSPNVFAILVAFANVALFGFLFLRRRAPSRMLNVGVALATVVLLGAGAVVLGHNMVAADERAVVRSAGQLKAGPDPKFDGTAPIGAGASVRVLSEDRGWLEVKSAAGTVGWIEAKAVTRI